MRSGLPSIRSVVAYTGVISQEFESLKLNQTDQSQFRLDHSNIFLGLFIDLLMPMLGRANDMRRTRLVSLRIIY